MYTKFYEPVTLQSLIIMSCELPLGNLASLVPFAACPGMHGQLCNTRWPACLGMKMLGQVWCIIKQVRYVLEQSETGNPTVDQLVTFASVPS
jgi:hypothetical protein